MKGTITSSTTTVVEIPITTNDLLRMVKQDLPAFFATVQEGDTIEFLAEWNGYGHVGAVDVEDTRFFMRVTKRRNTATHTSEKFE